MPQNKAFVSERANHCCEYCLSQLRFSPDPFAIEHVIPLAAGGLDELDNTALSCQGYNNHKYVSVTAVDPSTGKETRLYNPRHDKWIDHFAWAANFSTIVGITPTGRATVERLQLNREGVVNLRKALRLLGYHPPQ